LPFVLDAILEMRDEMPEPKDFYDGAVWTEADIRDLKWLLENGTSIEDVARFLCRATTIDEVAHMAAELGFPVRHE
jgi:hypothetical protein